MQENEYATDAAYEELLASMPDISDGALIAGLLGTLNWRWKCSQWK